jgi:hypothetical protein
MSNIVTPHEDATMTVELIPQGTTAEFRLDDFLEQMQAIKSALRETERFMSRGEPSLYLRINTLHKNSPIRASLEACPEDEMRAPQPVARPRIYASRVVRTMTTNLRVISKRHRIPTKADMPVLDSYRRMAVPAEKHRVDVKIGSGNNVVVINRAFREALDRIVGEDEYSYGSISGVIEGINIHERNRRFWLYPIVGATRIMGTFRARDKQKFSQAVGKYVTVHGRLSYKSWDDFPYSVLADSLAIHDEPYSDLGRIKGMSPDATGVLNAADFIDQLRDEWHN